MSDEELLDRANELAKRFANLEAVNTKSFLAINGVFDEFNRRSRCLQFWTCDGFSLRPPAHYRMLTAV